MKEDWFKTKFINPRTAEDNPQTERLEYAREFFKAFGEVEPRFSGAAMVGSTMKGYGHEESSDIYVVIFYYEKPKIEWREGIEVFGVRGPVAQTAVYTFGENFSKFQQTFDLERQRADQKTFDIHIAPGTHNSRDYFKINFFGQKKISIENLIDGANLLYGLSYPIIGTKNPKALMPIEKVLDAIRKAIVRANYEQKTELLKAITAVASTLIQGEFKKHFERKNLTMEEWQYAQIRLQALKDQLKRKFGLDVE